ncbi:phosphopantothenoylcysteine decarboxylase [Bacillus rossius redtenbacheri]|uniref:phosphopantothenoylcysteine decarboxylase n=1 Tax=Bacillus rossius redtenbacheri TaxID=93214 RepID=UPI002FDEA426
MDVELFSINAVNPNGRKKRVLLGCTGSVATIKVGLLVSQAIAESCIGNAEPSIEVRIVATDNAEHFIVHEDLPKDSKIYTDSDEWNSWSSREDPILHIELVKWADIFVIAPLDANTLAKLAQGLCDNLLTCVARAWNFDKPLLFCPAMNTRMWEHPVTAPHVATLTSWGYKEIPCVEKRLACGDVGMGAMAEVDDIIRHVFASLESVSCDEGSDEPCRLDEFDSSGSSDSYFTDSDSENLQNSET